MSFYSNTTTVNLTSETGGTGTTIATFLSGTTGYVDTWYEQSGKGNHATQTSTISQPIIDITNNCIDFGYSNNSSLFLNMPRGTVPVGVLDASYSFAVKHGNSLNISRGGFIGSGVGANNNCNNFRFNGGINRYQNYWWANDYSWGDTAGTTVPTLAAVTYNGTTKTQKGFVSAALYNTTTNRTGVINSNSPATQKIGVTNGTGGGSEFLKGQMYSLFIYSAELTEGDITILNTLS